MTLMMMMVIMRVARVSCYGVHLAQPVSYPLMRRCNELRQSARIGDAVRVAEVVEAGVDVDSPNEYGQTALFLAAAHGHSEVIR
jgi:ankyrin repeat protein